MGFECLHTNGGKYYETPVLDQMAREGISFTQTYSQPLCTPSRVKIMTGAYNFRNYEYFGYLNEDQPTFGTLMQDAGYATAIVGKWQLNGLAYDLPGHKDTLRPALFGFDEHCLWQLTEERKEGERFANPLIRQNGRLLPRNEDAYGPDVFCEYALDFIDRHQDRPFFLYYPMVLVHEPFVPTPDSEAWKDPARRYEKDTSYYKDMVRYTDKIVGKIISRLDRWKLDNTLLIFTADNGTHPTIYTKTNDREVQGAKGNTIRDGTHVPMVARWPDKMRQGKTYRGLIEFSDFYPTFAEIIAVPVQSDGRSFLHVFEDMAASDRASLFVHYDPRWSNRVNQFRNQFAQTTRYKLYRDGSFYDFEEDPLEAHPLTVADSTSGIKIMLQNVLDKMPELPAESNQQ